MKVDGKRRNKVPVIQYNMVLVMKEECKYLTLKKLDTVDFEGCACKGTLD